jgi:Ca2+-binding EF-hand superfamily protein
MKSTLSMAAVAMAALMAGTVMAGDSPRSDSPGMRADTDGDGRVSRAEATAAGSQRSAEWFDKIDRDKDGYVTQDELKQARETRKHMRHDEMKARMDERFKQADANGDGQLSLDEAQAKMPKLAQRFTEVDADKDGMLSRDELKRGGHGRAKPQN